MSPYQRGCRDALLDAAAQLDTLAASYDGSADRVKNSRHYNPRSPYHHGLYVEALGQAQVLRGARDICRSLAERCPDDPEEPTT